MPNFIVITTTLVTARDQQEAAETAFAKIVGAASSAFDVKTEEGETTRVALTVDQRKKLLKTTP
ncbi:MULTISPECIES: hypothetical protein [unclassified Rhizobium]|uniref:hypothetical protein n=1 Tax=unclassified Rhizobium TaxID=2613769 RepID=UPI0016218AD8|nr:MULTISPECIES: hypothetical protein [unclassified Rhizobium]MBB3319297.1 hypothetical protein [Rhizobium sp. BK181]MBB3542966.1 hypothetical protein [Rhizobium sp. BK399]MCS3743066.1 hypothetical protein [Rhizobium sp. BK661]MCS4094961.1 hypothetical protein [Rhizobium sp. BK176]